MLKHLIRRWLGIDETDPHRRVQSEIVNAAVRRKIDAEAQVRGHFGYAPDPCQHHNDGYNACTYCDAPLIPGTNNASPPTTTQLPAR
jgi:hypothetical protein